VILMTATPLLSSENVAFLPPDRANNTAFKSM